MRSYICTFTWSMLRQIAVSLSNCTNVELRKIYMLYHVYISICMCQVNINTNCSLAQSLNHSVNWKRDVYIVITVIHFCHFSNIIFQQIVWLYKLPYRMRERKIIASNVGSNKAKVFLYIIYKILTSDICTTEPKLWGCAIAQFQSIFIVI